MAFATSAAQKMSNGQKRGKILTQAVPWRVAQDLVEVCKTLWPLPSSLHKQHSWGSQKTLAWYLLKVRLHERLVDLFPEHSAEGGLKTREQRETQLQQNQGEERGSFLAQG